MREPRGKAAASEAPARSTAASAMTSAPTRSASSSMSKVGLWCMPLLPSARPAPTKKKQPGTRSRKRLTSSLGGAGAHDRGRGRVVPHRRGMHRQLELDGEAVLVAKCGAQCVQAAERLVLLL